MVQCGGEGRGCGGTHALDLQLMKKNHSLYGRCAARRQRPGLPDAVATRAAARPSGLGGGAATPLKAAGGGTLGSFHFTRKPGATALGMVVVVVSSFA
jgi:hypothetical protein